MNLSGIHPYVGMYDYYITENTQTSRIQVQRAKQGADQVPENLGRQSDKAMESHAGKARLEDSYDYAQRYEPGKTYAMKGKDSSLESLDMEQAISEMQRDHLLHQYQFFVGSSSQEEKQGNTPWTKTYENFNI